MRPLRYSINVTLDGCCHHEAGLPPDEESMRYWTAEMERADALLFGRVTYEMMESAWRKPATGTWPDWVNEWQMPFAEAIDRAKKYVVSATLDRVDLECRAGARRIGASGPAAQAGARRGPVGRWRDAPPGVGRSGTRSTSTSSLCSRSLPDTGRRCSPVCGSAFSLSSWIAMSSGRGRSPCDTGPREKRPSRDRTHHSRQLRRPRMTLSSDSRAENQRTRTITDDVIKAVPSVLVIGT